MEEFLRVALNAPTVLYTLMLSIVALYWVTVIIGLLDLDLFDVDVELDADLDVDLDVELDADFDVDGAEGIGGLAGVFSSLGWVGVPLTVTLTFLITSNWVLTYLGAFLLGGGEQALGWLSGLGVFAGSFLLSLPITSLLVRPLKPLFRSVEGARVGEAVVGSSVRVLSGRVTHYVGRAELLIDGQPVGLSVRCDRPDNGIKRGDEVLVIGYDEDRHTYMVEPMDQMKSSGVVLQHQDELSAKFDQLAKEAADVAVTKKK